MNSIYQPTGETFEVPREYRLFAERRTEFLLWRAVKFDLSIKQMLASAYVQGLRDAATVMQAKEIAP